MTKDECFTRIAAILTTLAEVDGTPESNLYMLCNMDMDAYNTLRHILTESKWVTVKSHYVTLTPAGRETAEKLNRILTK